MSKMRRRTEAPESNNEPVNDGRKVIHRTRIYRFANFLRRMFGLFVTFISVHYNLQQQYVRNTEQ